MMHPREAYVVGDIANKAASRCIEVEMCQKEKTPQEVCNYIDNWLYYYVLSQKRHREYWREVNRK